MNWTLPEVIIHVVVRLNIMSIYSVPFLKLLSNFVIYRCQILKILSIGTAILLTLARNVIGKSKIILSKDYITLKFSQLSACMCETLQDKIRKDTESV